MTAPLCHGTAGGCTEDVNGKSFWWHSPTCPVIARPAKRTVGQCNCGQPTDPRYHQPDCPALYPLQRQPGDEKDALTRLVALLSERLAGGLLGDAWDLISEAREEHRLSVLAATAIGTVAEIARSNAQGEVDRLTAELARAKALVTTLSGQQSEVRQQALKEGREQGHMDALQWLRARLCIATANDMAEALDALRDAS